jgi:predicted metalloprotease with PDZ domain
MKNWIGQIGIILTHELFHLWMPNSLSLRGDYDWFFEGFTLYVALQTALKLKLINFQEYLDTLARVYDSYLSYSDDQSLIEASEKRWTTTVPVVYDKGMLVAFVYDITVRSESSGATSLLDKYKLIFSGRAGDRSNANDVIIMALATSPATEIIARSYIRGRERVELEKILPAFGFQFSVDGPKSRLTVRKDLKDPEKHLMRSLGYSK